MNRMYALKSVRAKIEELCEGYGYSYTTIPMFADAYLYEQYKGVPDNKYIKFIDRNADVKVIRPDATFHILKDLRQHECAGIEKLYYSTEIIRENSVSRQYGIECFNDETALCDSEVIAIAIETLIGCGFDNIRVDIGHAGFVSALIEEIDCIDENSKQEVSTLIAKKNTVQLEDLLTSLGATKAEIKKLSELCMLFGEYEELIRRAEEFSVNEKMLAAVENIRQIYDCLSAYGYEKYVFLDMGFANEMDYYSAMMFKIYTDKAAKAVINGGRYDELAKRFANRTSACGFGADMDIIAGIYSDKCRDDRPYVKIYCPKEYYKELIAYAQQFRHCGWKVDIQNSRNVMYEYKGVVYSGIPSLNILSERNNEQ